MFPTEFPLALQCHPATPAPVVRALDVRAALNAAGDLELAYCLRGDMVRLRIPERGAPERTDGLWEHTCFEVFVGAPGHAAYREFNFSPSGQWAAYAFADYRERDQALEDALVQVAAPRIVARLSAGRLELEASLAAAVLPTPTEGTLLLAVAAVVEATDLVDGCHSYWALRHPAARPDFHHRDGFVLPLTSSSAA